MPLDPQLVEMMHEHVQLEHAGEKDKFNNFTFGAPASLLCQINRENVMTRGIDGRETISTVQVILAVPETEVSVNDKLTLPDGTTPGIIEIISTHDETGPFYLEVRA